MLNHDPIKRTSRRPPSRLHMQSAFYKLFVRPADERAHRVLLLLSYLLGLIAWTYACKRGWQPVDLLRDGSRPFTFFRYMRISDDTVVVFRPWRLPRFFPVTEPYIKFHTRSQPIFALRYGPRPSSYGCPSKHGSEPDGLLAYVGIFSAWEQLERRQLLRQYQFNPQGRTSGDHGVEMKFIMGRPASRENATLLQMEMDTFKDIVLLDTEENMNMGKTYLFFEYLATRSGPKPKFAFKMDDDVRISMHTGMFMQDIS